MDVESVGDDADELRQMRERNTMHMPAGFEVTHSTLLRVALCSQSSLWLARTMRTRTR